MRKKVLNAYKKSEIILNTGHSYQFVYDLEKRKYFELMLPDDNNDADTGMTRTEHNEIVRLMEEEGKPFSLGMIEGKSLECYRKNEYHLIDEIQQYHLKQKASEKTLQDNIIDCPNWNKLKIKKR